MLNYLSHLEQDRKLAYRTINIHRSCISFHLAHVDNKPVGDHPSVIRLMKGIFNSNPPRPKSNVVWDVSVLINYIRSLPPNADLSFDDLSRKLVCLLAVTCANRSSDIQTLDLSTLTYRPEGALFRHCHLRKTSSPNFLHDSFYPSYPSDVNICVVETLKAYISRTENLRSSSRLIISLKRPHKEVTATTISRWITAMMAAAGINTTVFKGHSTRSSSTTAAKSLEFH